MNEKYDELIQVIANDIYMDSKKQQKIVLENFNVRNEEHVALLTIANIVRSVACFKIYLKTGFLRYFIIKYIKGFKSVHLACCKMSGIDCNEYCEFINAQNDSKDLLKEVYNYYYKENIDA